MEVFLTELGMRLADIPSPAPLSTEEELTMAVNGLTEALQGTIDVIVSRQHPSPHSKRWWSRKLMELKKRKNNLSNVSYKFRVLPDHPVHEEHRVIRNKYSAAITDAKGEHWTTFLEGLSYSEVCMANCYISGENADGRKKSIPTLMQQPADPSLPPTVALTNEDKNLMLVKLMFPARPADCGVPQEDFKDQLPIPPSITEDQIQCHIAGLHPHKAPGVDEIPNIVLKKSAELISPYLLQIF